MSAALEDPLSAHQFFQILHIVQSVPNTYRVATATGDNPTMTALDPLTSVAQSPDERRALAELIRSDEPIPPLIRDRIAAILEHLDDTNRDALYLTPNQAAALVGVSRPLLNRLLDDGRIPHFKTEGGHRKIKRSDIDAYLAERDRVAAELVEARQNRRTVGQEIADDLGLDAAEARRLGFV